MVNLIVIKKFLYRHEAEHAKGLLEGSGIEAIVSADDCGGFRPDLTLGMGNVRLLVQKEDVDKAADALKVLAENVSDTEIEEIAESAENFQPPDEIISSKSDSIGLLVKFIIVAVFIFPLAVFLYGQFKTEIYKEYYLNKSVMRELTIKKGLANGLTKDFYGDGSLSGEAYYKNNKLEGEFRNYYRSGKLLAQGTYVNDKIDGVFKEYYENGKIKTECIFLNNGLDRNCKVYYESGNFWEKNIRKDGKRLNKDGSPFFGEEKTYYEDGTLEGEWNYKNGKFDGEIKQYYADGSIKSIAHFNDGKQEGITKSFLDNGHLEFEGKFYNDEPTEFKQYNREGILILEDK